MAYPTIAAPYGLLPVKLLSGVPFVGTTRSIILLLVVTVLIFFTGMLLNLLPEALSSVIRLILP